MISGIRENLKDIATPKVQHASNSATTPRSWLTGKMLTLSAGSQVAQKVQSAKSVSAQQQQPSTPRISIKTKRQQRPAPQPGQASPGQGRAGPAQEVPVGGQPAAQASEADSLRRSIRVAERQTPTSILRQLEGRGKKLFSKK